MALLLRYPFPPGPLDVPVAGNIGRADHEFIEYVKFFTVGVGDDALTSVEGWKIAAEKPPVLWKDIDGQSEVDGPWKRDGEWKADVYVFGNSEFARMHGRWTVIHVKEMAESPCV